MTDGERRKREEEMHKRDTFNQYDDEGNLAEDRPDPGDAADLGE